MSGVVQITHLLRQVPALGRARRLLRLCPIARQTMPKTSYLVTVDGIRPVKRSEITPM